MQGVIVRTVTSEGLSETQVGLAEELAFGQQGDPQVAAVDALAQHLDLPLGDDEELAAVFAFDDQLVAQRNLFGLEAAGHAGDDGVGQPGEQRHAAQRLRRERGRAAGDVDLDPLGLGQFDLGAVDAVGAAVDLHPRQQAQAASRGVIDIIFGEVFVVLARFLATEVVTLRCNRLSDMCFNAFLEMCISCADSIVRSKFPDPFSKPRVPRWS